MINIFIQQIPDEILNIDGYETIRNDRNHKRGGGVCIFLKQNIPYKRWINLESDKKETLWITIRPSKLPRDITNITIVGVYHPPLSNNHDLKSHIDTGVDSIRSKYSNSGFFIIGDFNHFPDKYLTNGHNLKQTVKDNTREKYWINVIQMQNNFTRGQRLYPTLVDQIIAPSFANHRN